jgi:tetratricopeptide (TPR) repeat protein
VSELSFKPSTWRTRAGPLAGIALVVGAVGYGCYVGGAYLWARHHARQGEQALAENRLEAARRHLARSLDFWKRDPEVHFLAARAARRLREFKEAENHLRACKELGVDADKLQLEWAMMQAQRDTPAASEGYLMALVQKNHADSALIFEALIQGYLKTFQLPKGHHCVGLWLQREPDSLQPVFWRGMIWEKLANNRAAVADFEQVVAGEPDNRAARLHLGTMLLGFKEYDRALEQFEWLRVEDPGNLEIRLGIVGCLIGQNRPEDAQKLLDELLRDYPDNPLALSEGGKVALLLNDPSRAEKLLRRSLAIDAYEPEAVYAMSQVLQQLGRAEEAEQYRDQHETIMADLKRLGDLGAQAVASPNDPNPRCQIGLIFMRNGHEQEGVGWLNTALQLDRRHRTTNQALAEYFERHGMTREAAQHRELAGPQH